MRHDLSDCRDRRGVLLLLVLSMLTLFLLMGVTLLTIATRARNAARAFAAANDDFEASPTLPRALLDEALLILIRGSKDENVRKQVTESLLGDMYEESGNKVPFRGKEPPEQPPEEVYDAFGHDDFLTEINDNGSIKTAAFGSGRGLDVDNDADGEMDGVWLDDVLPAMTSSRGGRLTFRVSCLVRDLDARINVNAHGGQNEPLGPAVIDASSLPTFRGGWPQIETGGTPSGRGEGRRKRPLLGPGRQVPGRGGAAYTLLLDRNAPRPAILTGQMPQNPFTPGELERVLRPYDPDCATLPPRLAALLDDLEGSARQVVTTDSWDTTNRKGRVARHFNDASPVRRFNLNRSLANDEEKRTFFTELYDIVVAAKAPANQNTAQWVANIVEFRDADSDPTTFPLPGGGNITGAEPNSDQLRWNVGQLVSVADLISVPVGSKDEIEDKINNMQPLFSLLPGNPTVAGAILEAVEVPSQFTATLDQDPRREPGRVNANTCDSQVWQVVAEGGPPGRPKRPYKSMWDLLEDVAGGAQPVGSYNRDFANRVASVATVRSNVFAVWITIEVTDSSPTADSPTCHRLFAIVDRSIPVDYQEGENTDVRQTIRLKRFLN
jgi:hypothetical protein